MTPTKFGIGQSVRRKEDDPLLRGGGRYVADLAGLKDGSRQANHSIYR